MTVIQSSPVSTVSSERGTTPFGGFNLTALRLEITRVLRNRRTLFFVLVFPSVFFFIFGLSNRAVRVGGDIAVAYVMISMAVYGAMVGTTSGGASVALERSLATICMRIHPTLAQHHGRRHPNGGIGIRSSIHASLGYLPRVQPVR